MIMDVWTSKRHRGEVHGEIPVHGQKLRDMRDQPQALLLDPTHQATGRRPRSRGSLSNVQMQSALALDAEEARVLVAHAGVPAARGVRVADGDVALFP